MWSLACSAAHANLLPEARVYADRAWQLSGPECYRWVSVWMGVRFLACPGMPRGFAFYAASDRGQEDRILVHPDAVAFVTEILAMRVFIETARAAGPGLVDLGDIMAAVLHSTLQPPDHPVREA